MEGLTTVVLIGIGLVLLYRYLSSYYGKTGMPGPKKYPIFGSALQLKKGQIHKQFYEFARQYGQVFEIKLFNTTAVMLNTAEIANKALCGDGYKQVFNNRPDIYIADYIYRRNAITFRNPDKLHGELRKALSRGLHIYGEGIPRFETVVKDEIHRVMAEIEHLEGRDFEVVSLTKRSLCNVISILLIGERATEIDVQNISDILEGQGFFMEPMVNTILLNLPFLIYLPFFKKRFDKAMLARQKLAERYFYQIKESRRSGEIRGLVDWYLQEQEKGEMKSLISDDVIVSSIVEIISAGLLTTVSILPTAILFLMHHPGYQVKLQEELDRVVGTDREPSVSEKHSCHFLEAIIMETMRYKPSNPFSIPHVCAEDTNFEGYKVKANTEEFSCMIIQENGFIVGVLTKCRKFSLGKLHLRHFDSTLTLMMNLWSIHHDEEVWGDPWVFRPERFLDEYGNLLPNNHVYMKSWQVFGIGRRKCPGMSLALTRIFLYLSCLFQRWSFTPPPGKCGPYDPRSDAFVCDLLINPKPFYCIAKPRN